VDGRSDDDLSAWLAMLAFRARGARVQGLAVLALRSSRCLRSGTRDARAEELALLALGGAASIQKRVFAFLSAMRSQGSLLPLPLRLPFRLRFRLRLPFPIRLPLRFPLRARNPLPRRRRRRAARVASSWRVKNPRIEKPFDRATLCARLASVIGPR